MTRSTLAVLAAGAAAVLLAACGGGTASPSETTPAPTASPSSSTTSTAVARPRRRRRRQVAGAPVGATRTVRAGGSTLSVTVTKVLEPLSGSGASLLPGTHAAGVALMIRNDRGATYDSTASGDVSVTTSSGAAAPLFAKQGVCQTPLTDFESLIGVGETHAGCVAFTITGGARIIAVRFSPHSRAPGSVVWRTGR